MEDIMRFLLVFAFFLLIPIILSGAENSDSTKVSIAVVSNYNEFADLNGIEELIQHEVFTFCKNSNKYILIDRDNIGTILSEWIFQNSGITSDEKLAEVGKIYGVQKVIIPKVNVSQYFFSNDESIKGVICNISLRIVDINTGRIEYSVGKIGLRAKNPSVLYGIIKVVREPVNDDFTKPIFREAKILVNELLQNYSKINVSGNLKGESQSITMIMRFPSLLKDYSARYITNISEDYILTYFFQVFKNNEYCLFERQNLELIIKEWSFQNTKDVNYNSNEQSKGIGNINKILLCDSNITLSNKKSGQGYVWIIYKIIDVTTGEIDNCLVNYGDLKSIIRLNQTIIEDLFRFPVKAQNIETIPVAIFCGSKKEDIFIKDVLISNIIRFDKDSKYEIIEREDISTILDEWGFQISGIASGNTDVSAGMIKNINQIINIQCNNRTLSLKRIDVSNTKIFDDIKEEYKSLEDIYSNTVMKVVNGILGKKVQEKKKDNIFKRIYNVINEY